MSEKVASCLDTMMKLCSLAPHHLSSTLNRITIQRKRNNSQKPPQKIWQTTIPQYYCLCLNLRQYIHFIHGITQPSVSPLSFPSLACHHEPFYYCGIHFHHHLSYTFVGRMQKIPHTDRLKPSFRQITCMRSCTWTENSCGGSALASIESTITCTSVDYTFYRKHCAKHKFLEYKF